MKTVIFACVHNPGPSQMAGALVNRLTDPDHARALSARSGHGRGTHGQPRPFHARSRGQVPEQATVLGR